MVIARVKINGVHAVALDRKTITAGMVGAQVQLDYTDPVWEGLRKTVVFYGATVKDIITDETVVTIPAEVLKKPNVMLTVGVYGVDAEGCIVIPTLLAEIGQVRVGTNPSGDTTTNPTLPVWSQVQQLMTTLAEQCEDARDRAEAAAQTVNGTVWKEVDQLKRDLEQRDIYVTPEMFGAVGDGQTDDTEAIQRAVETEYPVQFDGRKTYCVTGLTIHNDVVLNGNGAKLLCSGKQQGSRGAFCFYIEKDETGTALYDVSISDLNIQVLNHIVGVFRGYQGNCLEIRNCRIEGNASNDPAIEAIDSPGANEGIAFYNFRKFRIVNNTIHDIRGYAIAAEENNVNGVISDNTIRNTGRGSIYVRAYNKNVEIARNDVEDSVRCFTVTDGAIDLYGPGNENIYISKNHVTGYGRSGSMGIGIRIKGSKHVVCSENTVLVDESTYSFALILMQDRDGVGNEDIVLENNSLSCKGNKSNYMIRDDHDTVPTKELSIRNNFLITESGMCIVGISIRRGIEGLSVTNNSIAGNGNPIEFYQADDFPRKHVLFSGNRVYGADSTLVFWKIQDLKIVDNLIKSENESASLVSIVGCENVFVDRNSLINAVGLSSISNSNCSNLAITETNTLLTRDGVTDLHNYTFLRNISGPSEMTFDSMEDGLLELQFYGFSKQTIPDGEEISPENIIEYQSVNDDSALTITVNGVTCPDSCVKRGLPVSTKDIANYIDSTGQGWIADYRDWANGVDWHFTEEYVFTGEETVTDYDSETIVVYWDSLENDKQSIGSDYRYRYQMLCNAFAYSTGTGGIGDANAEGTRLQIRGCHSYFTDAAGFQALCRTLHEAGTPIKVLYLLKVPYTTPIDQAELNAYHQIPICNDGNTVSNNQALFTKVVYLLNDNYVSGTKKIVNGELEHFTATTLEEKKTDIPPREILDGVSIKTDGEIVEREGNYSVAVFDAADFLSDLVTVTYAVSSDIVNVPAFVVTDAEGNTIDTVMCATSDTGVFTVTYSVPENTSRISVNIRTSQSNTLQCIAYEEHNPFREHVYEYAYSKAYIDEALKSYIADVAGLVGGDA